MTKENDKEDTTLHDVLYSNRSSCHFELGNYQTAVEDATACLSLLIKERVEGDRPTRTTTI
jgi:hypothetical protein